MTSYHRDDVFIPGGQPTITYVDRQNQDTERNLARAIASPNQIASLSGPTKSGKTVLCKKVLELRQYVWVDGGKVRTSDEFWTIVAAELNMPSATINTDESQVSASGSASLPLVMTAGGSVLTKQGTSETRVAHSMGSSLGYMTSNHVVLVIDDFHYIAAEVRTEIMRNIKGAVYNGLKVVLLSVTHRVFDAIQAESELTGRFTAVILPPWTQQELKQIPFKGFAALATECHASLVDALCIEAQDNPMLMQRFCWELCFDCHIDKTAGLLHRNNIPAQYDPKDIYLRIAHDAGLPVYQKLVAGPQSRKVRAMRPLRSGGQADIYEVMLKAIAETGPKPTIKYDELKNAMSSLLVAMVPQKHEVTSALKHLAKIAREMGSESAVDWNEHSREITVADPYLRFYLRWKVRGIV